MDNYAEQLVKREQTGSDKRKKALTYVFGIMMAAVLLMTVVLTFGSIMDTSKNLSLSKINDVISGSFDYEICKKQVFRGALMSIIAVVLAIAAVYGTFAFGESMQVEYEYLMTNGEMDIDKIIAQKKRKTLITVDVRKFESFGKYDDSTDEDENMTVVICSDNIASHEYYADLNHPEHGSTRIIFSPSSKMLEAMKIYMPAKLRNSLS